MSENSKQAHKPFFPEHNYVFPKPKPDVNFLRYYAALREAGFKDWFEIRELLDGAETEEERDAIRRRIPMKPRAAVYFKKRMGRAAFLAEGYNLDFANSELGSDWLDKY